MKQSANRISRDNSDRRYFTMVPNLLFARCRDPYDLVLWIAIKSVAGEEGACTLGTRDLAALTGMSIGRVVNSRSYLIRSGLLLGGMIHAPGYDQPCYSLRIPDLWTANTTWRQQQPDDLRGRIAAIEAERSAARTADSVHHMNTENNPRISPGEQGCTPHEHLERDGCSCGEPILKRQDPHQEDNIAELWKRAQQLLNYQLLAQQRRIIADTTAHPDENEGIVIVTTSETHHLLMRLRLHDRIVQTLASLGHTASVRYEHHKPEVQHALFSEAA